MGAIYFFFYRCLKYCCIFATMFKRLRTYGAIVFLAIAGLFIICHTIDEYRDASVSVCANSSILDSFSVDDINLDENNNLFIPRYGSHNHKIGTFPSFLLSPINFNSTTIVQISKELRIGLMRRYSPRNMFFSWVNYALFVYENLKE